MKNLKIKIVTLMIVSAFVGCTDDFDSADPPVSLRIVNAIQDIGTVELRDFEGSVASTNAISLRYGANGRFTFPANQPVEIMVAPETDTLNILLNQTLTLDTQGGIFTNYLYGDTLQVESFVLEQTFQNYTDSIFGASFVHVSDDTNPISIRAIQLDTLGVADTISLAQSLPFQSATPFSQFEATARIDNYIFEFVDAEGNVLESSTIDPLRRRSEKVFRNITCLLIGRTDDGSGSSTLETVQYDNF